MHRWTNKGDLVSDFFRNLRNAIFGNNAQDGDRGPTLRRAANETSPGSLVKERAPQHLPASTDRKPYFVQIGFDFGTAFSKCVCRDVLLDKAWVHLPPDSQNPELPFLLANAVTFAGGQFKHLPSVDGIYQEDGLHHVKMALQKLGLGELDDSVLAPYRGSLRQSSLDDLHAFVECCAIYLLGGAFGGIKADIAQRFPDSVDGDYIAINMAVPVADADHPEVNRLFDRVLRYAWVLSEDLCGYPSISIACLESAIKSRSDEAEHDSVRDSCFIYPEVSANVQGFVRSRTSSPGLYLFSDTGAGTVDQSVFLFARPDGQDHLTYLHAEVLPLGSSHIERIAAEQEGDSAWSTLERWRQMKESGHDAVPLTKARDSIHEHLSKGTAKTIAQSKHKLIRRDQINRVQVIFGGGGHCDTPYRSAVLNIFDHALFRIDEIEDRRRKRDQFEIGMPSPRDLRISENQKRWIKRLTVAYGLSFEKGQLATFDLPGSVETPRPEQVWRPMVNRRQAPSKDEV